MLTGQQAEPDRLQPRPPIGRVQEQLLAPIIRRLDNIQCRQRRPHHRRRQGIGKQIRPRALAQKVIAAGPGNPPVIVDDTADIKKAAKDIVDGASFDNNVVCIAEKEVFAYANIIDELVAQMQQNGAYLVSGADIDKIVNTVLVKQNDTYVINRKYVGHNASVILKDSGVSYTGDPRLVFHAIASDPLTAAVLSLAEIKSMVNEMLAQNKEYLPQFKHFEA